LEQPTASSEAEQAKAKRKENLDGLAFTRQGADLNDWMSFAIMVTISYESICRIF